MSWLTLLSGVVFLAFQLHLYRRQRQLFPRPEESVRENYNTTWPTRLFKTLKFPLGAAVIFHLLWQPFRAAEPLWQTVLLGGIVGVMGLILLDRSLLALGENFSPCDQGQLPFEHVKRGPYRFLSHPIYVANLLIFGGMALQSFSWWIGTSWIVLLIIYIFSARDEKKALHALEPRSTAFK